MYSALSDAYRIFITRNDGAEVLMVIERTLPAESFSTAEWRAANAEFYEWRETKRGVSCDPREPTRPDAKPFLDDLFVAPDGKLWVEVVRTAGNRWEVFDTGWASCSPAFPPPPRRGRCRSGVRIRLPCSRSARTASISTMSMSGASGGEAKDAGTVAAACKGSQRCPRLSVAARGACWGSKGQAPRQPRVPTRG